jgi:hypothetical protein
VLRFVCDFGVFLFECESNGFCDAEREFHCKTERTPSNLERNKKKKKQSENKKKSK